MADNKTFGSVPGAVAWADELLTRPDVKSQLRPRQPIGGGGFTRDELRWFAHQVSQAVEQTRPHLASIAMRSIWGEPKSGSDSRLAAHLANLAIEEFPRKARQETRVIRLAEAVIQLERRYHHTGRRTTRAELSRAMKIRRQSFLPGRWNHVTDEMQRELNRLLVLGENSVRIKLEEMRMLRAAGR